MDARKVRVYIKDSLLKPYERARLSGTEQQILGRLGIPTESEVSRALYQAARDRIRRRQDSLLGKQQGLEACPNGDV